MSSSLFISSLGFLQIVASHDSFVSKNYLFAVLAMVLINSNITSVKN